MLSDLARELPTNRRPDLPDENLDPIATAQRYLDIASQVEREIDRTVIATYIQRNYANPHDDPPPLLSAVVNLPLTQFATTNYDPWVIRALTTKLGRLPTQLVPTTTPRCLSKSQADAGPFVLMLHGTAEDPTGCILTSEDYDRFMEDHSFQFGLQCLANHRSLLFVGYSLRDPDIELVLREWRRILNLEREPARHWFIGRQIDPENKSRLWKLGVIPIDLPEYE